jgi:hypothetical protein
MVRVGRHYGGSLPPPSLPTVEPPPPLPPSFPSHCGATLLSHAAVADGAQVHGPHGYCSCCTVLEVAFDRRKPRVPHHLSYSDARGGGD